MCVFRSGNVYDDFPLPTTWGSLREPSPTWHLLARCFSPKEALAMMSKDFFGPMLIAIVLAFLFLVVVGIGETFKNIDAGIQYVVAWLR